MNHIELIKAIAIRRGVPVKDIFGPCRKQALVDARIEIARRLRQEGYSHERIGQVLHKDHSTITYYLHRDENI